MQIAVLAVRTWPVVPDLISLGSIAESQLQGNHLLPDGPIPSGVSSRSSIWSQHLSKLSHASDQGKLSQQEGRPIQQGGELSQQELPALSPSMAGTLLHHVADTIVGHKAPSDWHSPSVRKGLQHQASGRAPQQRGERVQHQGTPTASSVPEAPIAQAANNPLMGMLGRQGQQARRPQTLDSTLTGMLDSLSQLSSSPGLEGDGPAHHSRPGWEGMRSRSAGLKHGRPHSQRPTAVVSGSIGTDFPMELLGLPDQPAGPGESCPWGSTNSSAAEALSHSLVGSQRSMLHQLPRATAPSLHHTGLHGMHLGTHDMSRAEFPSSLLNLPNVSIPPLRSSMDDSMHHEARLYGDPTRVHSLAELCLAPRNSSSAGTLAEDTIWAPELPVLPLERHQDTYEEPMDLTDLL